MNTGIFGEGFPYSNFHDLNMDWIIKIAKDFLDQYTHIQEIIEQGKEDINTLTESGITQIGDLTATSLQELQNKADNLEALLQQWYNTHSQDIANQLTNALADLNSWYTTHQNYLNQTLAENIAEFNSRAEAKAAQTIATIPDDYTTLANSVANTVGVIKNSFSPIQSIYPIVYGYMDPDNDSIGNRKSLQDYKIKVFNVSEHKSLILNGTTPNSNGFYAIMFLQDNVLAFGTPLNVSAITAGLLNSDIDASFTNNRVTYVNYEIPIPADCNYVLIQDYNNELTVSSDISIYSNIIKGEPLSHIRFENKYFDTIDDNLASATGFEAKMYHVENINKVFIKGTCRGDTSYVCPIAFLTDIVGTGTLIPAPSATIPTGTMYTIDSPIEIPDNAKYMIVSSYTADNVMVVFSCENVENICTYKPGIINCIGDSLTMGASEGTLHPYSDTLQKLLGNGKNAYQVENNGIGGENTLTIASRLNGLCALTGEQIEIPYNQLWFDLGSIKSIYDRSVSLDLLRQGTALQGCYANGHTEYRNYYVYIAGIRMVLAYWGGLGYKLVRTEDATDGQSTVVPAGEPIIFERTLTERDIACNIIWTGVNDSDKTILVEKIKAILSYYNNQNYIVIGLHNYTANVFTEQMRTEYSKAFGVRFFDIDRYTRTTALTDCGITPTAEDTTAIQNGLCPPSLLADSAHFKAVFYDALAKKLYDKLKEINVIEY